MLFVLFSSQIEFAFAQIYDAPGVEWNKYHYPTKKPNGTTQTAAQSGEDWYYDVKPVYQGGTQIGYICAGYTSFANENNPNETCNNMGNGVGTNPDLKNMEYCNYRKGADYAKLVFVEMDGHVKGYNGSSEWYKIYGISGAEKGFNSRFYGVTPTSDGGYIAVGSIRVTNGFKYNPTPSNPTGSNLVCNTDTNFNVSNFRRERFYVVKVTSTGSVQWQYIYGFEDNLTEAGKLSSIGFDVMQKSNGNYILVGMSDVFISANNKRERLFSLELNSSGQIVNKFITSNANDTNLGSGFNRLRALTYKPATNEYFATGYTMYSVPQGGRNSDVVVVKISGLNSSFMGINTVTPSGSINFNAAVDIEYNATLDRLLLPVITNISGTDGGIGGENPFGSGVGKIQRIRTNTLTQDAIYDFDSIQAYDLWMGITNTFDGGFAVVSTVKNQTGSYFQDDSAPFPLPYTNSIYNTCVDANAYKVAFSTQPNGKFDKRYWGTAAKVIRYNSSGTKLWEKVVEESTPNPSQGSNIGQPDKHGDLKRQECFYKIAQAQDGGLVFCGNNSNNFDDDVLVKLHNECQTILLYLLYNPATDIGWFNSNNPNKVLDFEIPNTVTWNSSKKIDCIIRIKAGGTLNITGANTKIEFTDTKKVGRPSKIIVEPGGKLFINGATLTGIESCNSMWEGIEVWGLGFYNQSNLANQGYVELSNNATIKNARVAINVGQRDYVSNNQWAGIDYSKDPVDAANYFLSGGKVVANNSNFINNKVGVRFQPYVLYNNTSYFSNTLFENNAYLLGEKNPDGTATVPASTQAWIINNDGIKFNACTFQNTISGLALNKRGTGILAQDADFQVLPICTAFVWGACFGFNKSKFNNFEYAISATSSPNSFTNLLKVDMAEFNGNKNSIFLQGINQATQITRNTINVANVFESYGIYLHTCSQNYVVEDNTISNTNANTQTYGIVNWAGGALNNRIYRNTFNNIFYSTTASADNANATNQSTGLEYKCNTYNTSRFDIVVNNVYGANGRIRNPQGICPTSNNDPQKFIKPAGNIFNNGASCSGSTCHIFANNGVDAFTYNYHKQGTQFEPIYFSTTLITPNDCLLDVIPNYQQACPTNFPPSSGGGGSQQGFALMQQSVDETNELENRIAGLENTLAKGNSAALFDMVADARFSSSQLKSEIRNVGPYLSDNLLNELIIKTANPLTFNDLVEIIIDNAPLSVTVYETLEKHRPAVAYYHTVVDAQENKSTSARTQLQGLISVLGAERTSNIYRTAHYFVEQDSVDALLQYLTVKNEPIIALPYLIKKGLYNDAINALEKFDSNEPGNTEFVWLQQLHIELLQKEKQWKDIIDSVTIIAIKEIADGNTYAAGQAQSILNTYFGYNYKEVLPKIEESAFKKEPSKNKVKYFDIKEQNIVLYPNPASNSVYIKINAVYDYSITANIYDINGKLLATKTIDAYNDIAEINTSELPSGNYICQFTNEAKVLGEQKLVIIKQQ
jgi:hypothetical protein